MQVAVDEPWNCNHAARIKCFPGGPGFRNLRGLSHRLEFAACDGDACIANDTTFGVNGYQPVDVEDQPVRIGAISPR